MRNRCDLTPVLYASFLKKNQSLNVLHGHQRGRRSKVAHAVPVGASHTVPHGALSIPVHPQGHCARGGFRRSKSSSRLPGRRPASSCFPLTRLKHMPDHYGARCSHVNGGAAALCSGCCRILEGVATSPSTGCA